ncbi:hypothetical protein LCGC14_0859500 [marine sediment metagenome]|uniref:Uncharacterized protein n=1 Tax=marine sediment metagenome TaxID=412755 RepID=A0A0F9RSG7_9ZZZZ
MTTATYRIDREAHAALVRDVKRNVPDGVVPKLIGYGVLVPDGRLQAIADAWQAFIEAPPLKKGTKRLEVDDLLYALTEEEQ